MNKTGLTSAMIVAAADVHGAFLHSFDETCAMARERS